MNQFFFNFSLAFYPVPSKDRILRLSASYSREDMSFPVAQNEAIMLSQCKCDAQEGTLFLNYTSVKYSKPF